MLFIGYKYPWKTKEEVVNHKNVNKDYKEGNDEIVNLKRLILRAVLTKFFARD